MMNVIELQAMSLTTYIICDQQLCSVFTSPTFFYWGDLILRTGAVVFSGKCLLLR